MTPSQHAVPLYQLLLLGDPQQHRQRLREEIEAGLSGLGMPKDTVVFLNTAEAGSRDLAVPVMAVFFGGPGMTSDTPLVAELLEDSVVIAPVVDATDRIGEKLPPQLAHINALAVEPGGQGMARLATVVFETFRLLRSSRRLFISYKRTGSQPLADKLYDALDARGFDVFIDVRSVPPAHDFQSELWHRMTDSDVIILIDTPGFREGRWTAAELAQANATNVQILHLLWPGQTEDPASAFSRFHKLTRSDFYGYLPLRGQWIRRAVIERICDEAERLRARALAARQKHLIDNFCDAARDLGLDPAVQVEGWVALKLASDKKLAVVPAVGVPTSNRINEIFEKISDPKIGAREIWVLYDNRGILQSWLSHLDWLDEHLPLRSIQMAKAPMRLSEALR